MAVDFTTRLKWTVLPAGADLSAGGLTLHVSVLASPEMLATKAEDTAKRVALDGSPFLNWPQTLAGLSFQLQLGAIAVHAKPQSRGDQQLWQRFFGGVTAALRDPTGAPTQPSNPNPTSDVRHFSYNSAHQELRTFYTSAAADSQSARRPDASRQLRATSIAPANTEQPLPSVRHLRETFGTLVQTSRTNRLREETVLPQVSSNIGGLIGAAAFYDRSPSAAPSRERFRAATDQAPPDTDMDFHQWVSSFAQYPWLQRKLGLLLDFDVPISLAEISTGAGLVSIVVNPAISGPTIRTHYRLANNPPEFESVWDDPSAAPYGCLPLGGKKYSLAQVSIDGGAIRAEGFARELQVMAADSVAAPPALRTGPLVVAKEGLAQDLAGKVARAQQQHDSAQHGNAVELHAEDLVKGIRVDVLDHDRWFPLCERECTLVLSGVETKEDPKFSDEGWVSLAVTTQGDENFLHEAIFSWSGWSLVAPRPGKTMGQAGDAIDWDPRVQGKPRIEVKPGSTKFPAYRLGRKYGFRARTVDLAGRSKALPNSANLDSVTTSCEAFRYEPVGAPLIVPRSNLSNSPGESARVLVIRTGEGSNSTDSTERHVAPPPIDYVLAELHSLFDEKGAPSADKYKDIVRSAKAPALVQEISWFVPSPFFDMDYTRDPLCAGVVFFGLPNTDTPFFVHQSTAEPLRLRLVSGNTPPAWHQIDRLLTVAVPVGHTANVQVASLLRPAALDVLGMWDWMQHIDQPPSKNDAGNGLLWPLTPSRPLTFIHAVQRPLLQPLPSLDTIYPAMRQLNDTFVDLEGTIALDVLTTGEVELIGDYTEWVDDPSADQPIHKTNSSHALAITPLPGTLENSVKFGKSEANSVAETVRQSFPDTHYRYVAYTAIATSRFKAQFGYTNEQLASRPDLITTRTPNGSDRRRKDAQVDKRAWLHVPSTARPNAPEVYCILPLYGWCDPNPGKPGNVDRKMLGGALRVYLKRGWYSSGDGEQLAVVLWPSATEWFTDDHNEVPVDVRPFVSQWGMDPIWTSKPLTTPLGPKHFRNNVGTTDKTHTLPEFEVADNGPYPEDRKMSGVLFNPVFDKTRKLWYCDIEMNETLTYTPFVRLALARYQSFSIEQSNPQNELIRDVHFSHSVLADFVQLPTGRSVTIVQSTVTGTKHGGKELTVMVSGMSYSAVAAGESHSSLEASLEVKDHNAPLGWRPMDNKTVVLNLNQSSDDSTTTWQNVIPVDHHIVRGKYRVVIRETMSLPNATTGSGKRLIFADVLDL